MRIRNAPELGASSSVKIVKELPKELAKHIGGAFNPTTGEMVIPMSSDDESLAKRFHEQLHAVYSPKKMWSEPRNELTPQIYEDCRIYHKAVTNRVRGGKVAEEAFERLADLHSARAKDATDFLLKEKAAGHTVPKEKLYEALLTSISAVSYRECAENISSLEDAGVVTRLEADFLQNVAKALYYNGMRAKQKSKTQQLLLEMEELFLGAKKPEEARKHGRRKRKGHEKFLDLEKTEKRSLDKGFPFMKIEKLPLSQRLPKKFQEKLVFKPTACGLSVKNMDRWVSDQKIFGNRRVIPEVGGTILIDASGSMHLNNEDIMDLMKARPAATIAYYSGEHSEGVLTIAAKNGLAAKMLPRHGDGNIVDAPALGWLNKQEEPRVWICDGRVTTFGDTETAEVKYACALLIRRGNVKQYLSIDHFLTAKF